MLSPLLLPESSEGRVGDAVRPAGSRLLCCIHLTLTLAAPLCGPSLSLCGRCSLRPTAAPIPPCYRLLILGLKSHLKHPFLKEKEVFISCCVQLFRIPWNEAHQAPQSTGFSRQEHWSGLPFLSPRDLLDPGVKPRFPALRADSLPSELPFMLVLQSHFKHHFLRKAHPKITFHQMVIPSQVSSWTFL